MIKFNNEEIKCGELHGNLMPETPKANFRNTMFFGVNGESEISGGAGGRNISVECWIFDKTWVVAGGDTLLLNYIKSLEEKIQDGIFGALQISGNVNFTYNNCKLREVNRDPELTPRIDEIGMFVTVDPGDDPIPVWWSKISLVFHQLSIS